VVAPFRFLSFSHDSRRPVENRLDIRLLRRSFSAVKAISEITKDASELPPSQRLTLARILLDLSEEDQDFSPEVESAWEQEIGGRMEEVKAGRARSKSFGEVFAAK